MQTMLKIGWRNLLRNKRRSLLTSSLIGIGLAAMIIADGFMVGMTENMIQSVTSGIMAEGQIHHPAYKDGMSVERFLVNMEAVDEILNTDQHVQAYTKRVVSSATISSPKNMKGVRLYGILPDQENRVSNLHQLIIAGEYVKDESSLMIGERLRQKLEVELGQKVVLTLTEAHSEDISQSLFRISGVFKSGSAELDERTVFIFQQKAQELLKIGNHVHEIALRFKDRSVAENTQLPFWRELNQTGNLAQSWKELMAAFVSMLAMTDQSKGMMAFVLMCLVAFGILNSLFMALYERSFEFGVLRAIGTRSRHIVLMVVSEAGMLSLISSIVGIFIALLVSIPLTQIGVDYSGMEISDVTIKEPIYYVFKWRQYTLFPLITILYTMFISLYPAIHATKIQVATALKQH